MNNKFHKLYKSCGQSVSYITEEITHVCKNMKKRAPGSVGEHEAAGYMAGILKNKCGCKNVKIERFKEHPDSFYGYCMINSVLDVITCVGFLIHPLISLIAGILTLLLFLFFFVLYKPVIDIFFPKKESVNVTAVRNSEKEVKRRIFLCGHIDAAWEFTLNYHFGGVIFEIPNVGAFSGVTFYTVLSIISLCGAGAWTKTAGLCGLIFLPLFILAFFTYNPRQITDGANDNLTGCYMGIALLKEMERQGIRLENTEVGVLLTGSEEAGTRGAKAWSRMHKKDYGDVPTFILCLDTIHDPEFLAVNMRDLNSTVRADQKLAEAFLKAAEDINVPCKKSRVPLFGGSTDSAAFTQGGFRSVAVTGLNHKLEDYYHTRKDSYDNLNTEGIENCYKAVIRFVELIDEGMLDQCSGL